MYSYICANNHQFFGTILQKLVKALANAINVGLLHCKAKGGNTSNLISSLKN